MTCTVVVHMPTSVQAAVHDLPLYRITGHIQGLHSNALNYALPTAGLGTESTQSDTVAVEELN